MDDVLTLDSTGQVMEVEGKLLEFKRDLSSPTKPLRTVVAFANSAGGSLVIGVNDDGSVSGVKDPLAEDERITSLITDWISPQLVPGIDIVTLGETTVLVVDVPLSTRRPHFMKDQGPESGVYVRLGSSTRQADPALVAELEWNARGVAFEDLPESRAALGDLDLEGLSDLCGRQTGVEDLIALGLAVKQGGETVPTNAGILAACNDPTRFLPSARVQCARLRGPHGTDIFDQREIHGPMPRAVDKVMEFLLKHAYKTAVFSEVKRRDIYSIPVEAIREVVVNALVHANYAERSTPIRVGFYDDRVQVDSPGLLLPGMTVESMRRASRLRNPSLARIFREAGVMEQWGTGVQRVFEQLAEAGLPEPRVEEVMDRLRFTVYVPSHAPESPSATSEYQGNAPSEQGVSKSSEQGSNMSEQALALLTLASEGPRSRAELLTGIDRSDAYGNYKRHLLPLLEGGYLARTIPEKPNSQNQRYRITDAGREILAEKETTK
ncbi:AlbA family DNA-binding domain-containing protein [Pseudoclavibacter soli]|uniref:AlbA family DNA-binding domain-containing protein n=1 Tax=Pseudoclavibacter soli TaxID=452623 RepID=UPI0004205FEE|nr:helix-turn-helix domain-containing protein [Pseudoclavibacter soli]